MARALSEYNFAFGCNVPKLKDLQQRAIVELLAGKDCMCSLPTGYGKSLIYEILPFIDPGCLVIVISPLDAIIDQQLKKLGKMACSLKNNTLSSGTISFLFCHPEQITENKELTKLFCTRPFKDRKTYCVIDEAHCILEWGQDFRPAFTKLYHLKAIFASNILTLSATVTEKGQKAIASSLLLSSPTIISASPSKDNINLIVRKRPSPSSKGNSASTPYTYICEPLIRELKNQLDHFPLTIVYFKTMQWIGFTYEMARRLLGADFLVDGQYPRVVMFHSSMEKKSGKLKEMILESLRRPDEECHIRMILSSVALGMGADLKHVARVIHAGPPSNLETYVQEIGRAGRCGVLAEAVLYFNKGDIAINSMRPEMRDYCSNTEKCRRSMINEYFGFKSDSKLIGCCDICDTSLGLEWDFAKTDISTN